jgi:tetratricopeptide (TPR) repeat protein
MKKTICLLVLILISHNFLIAQKIKKEQTIVKSTAPMDVVPELKFKINRDSTLVSKETFSKMKNIELLIDKEENAQAVELINTMDENDLNKTGFLLAKATLELKLEDFSNSYNSFSKCIPLSTNDSIKSSLYYVLGVIDYMRNLEISGIQNFKKAYETDNHNYMPTMLLAQIYLKKEDYENAILYFKKTVEINPNLNNVWNNLAFLYQQTNNNSEAKKIFSKIIADEPDSPLPYSNRSYSNLKLGFTKQALEDVNKSIKLFPENSYAFRNRALIYVALKEQKKACTDIETALKLGYKEKYGFDLDVVESQNCKK